VSAAVSRKRQNLVMQGLYDGEFAGFKAASSEQLDAALQDAIVAVDANVLLDLYRFRPQTSQDLITVLRKLGDRLVVPHQALREFWRRRQRTLDSPRRSTKEAADALAKSGRSVCDTLASWAKAVGVDHDELAGMTARVNSFLDELRGELQTILQDAGEERAMDPVLDRLDELLAGRVTLPLGQEEWTACIAEANRRIDSEDPPGYLDAGKGDSDLPEGGAGDYLVWYQATRYAHEQDRDLLIVTRDEKEDWWWRQHSEFIGPRPELVLEYQALSGHQLFLMRPLDLLKRAVALGVEVDRASSAEIAAVADAERYPYVEHGTGRRYQRVSLTSAAAGRPALAYEWRGVHLPEGRCWKYTRENLELMYEQGRIEFRGRGTPVGKRYFDEQTAPGERPS